MAASRPFCLPDRLSPINSNEPQTEAASSSSVCNFIHLYPPLCSSPRLLRLSPPSIPPPPAPFTCVLSQKTPSPVCLHLQHHLSPSCLACISALEKGKKEGLERKDKGLNEMAAVKNVQEHKDAKTIRTSEPESSWLLLIRIRLIKRCLSA